VQPEAVLLETRSPDADLAFDAPKTSTEEVLARLENCANTLSELRRAHRRAERSRGRIADCRRGDRSCRHGSTCRGASVTPGVTRHISRVAGRVGRVRLAGVSQINPPDLTVDKISAFDRNHSRQTLLQSPQPVLSPSAQASHQRDPSTRQLATATAAANLGVGPPATTGVSLGALRYLVGSPNPAAAHPVAMPAPSISRARAMAAVDLLHEVGCRDSAC